MDTHTSFWQRLKAVLGAGERGAVPLPAMLHPSDAAQLMRGATSGLASWTIVQLPLPIHAGVHLRDGTLLVSYFDNLFVSRDGGLSFKHIGSIVQGDPDDGAARMIVDRDERIFISRRKGRALLMSRDGGRRFEPVLSGLADTIRGFSQDRGGRLYTGSYDFDGPAKLYASDDGVDWRIVKHWDALHVHDVRVNPHNDWLYVVTGEGNPQRTKESHSVYRSTDQGQSFSCVFAGRGRRPLFTAVNFDGPRVLLGTDHVEGGNYIASFVDTGEGEPYEAETMCVLPGTASAFEVQPFVHFMEWMGSTLFVGARGHGGSFLLASRNLSDWELAYATVGHWRTGSTCTSASQGSRDGRVLLINGVPGLAVIAVNDERSPGLTLGGAQPTRQASGAAIAPETGAELAAAPPELRGLPQERIRQAALLEIGKGHAHERPPEPVAAHRHHRRGRQDRESDLVLPAGRERRAAGRAGQLDHLIQPAGPQTNAVAHRIHMVALGLGVRAHLTQGAEERLRAADRIYVMAQPRSWMVEFAAQIAGAERIRHYMPASVSWGAGWADDPIFEVIVAEVEALVAAGQDVVFAMAGDVAIFGNIADSIVPRLRARDLHWDVYPGVSFLNALSIETGEPLVGEGDELAVVFVPEAAQLDDAFAAANVVVLYNPGGVVGLREYIRDHDLESAVAIFHGVFGKQGQLRDLLREDEGGPINGLVVLRRRRRVRGPGSAPATRARHKVDLHLGVNAWDDAGRLFAIAYPDQLYWAPNGEPQALAPRYRFEQRPTDARGLFVDTRGALFVSLKGHAQGAFGRTYRSVDSGHSFELVLPRCCWGLDEDREGNLFAGVYHERGDPDMECALYWSADHGCSWTDIAPAVWREQMHVHHLAINPVNGWLYATLGDKPGLNGCWRAKLRSYRLASAARAGDAAIALTAVDGLAVGVELCLPGVGRCVIGALSGTRVELARPLAADLPAGAVALVAEWRLKFADEANRSQFAGLCFDGERVFLADDNGLARNPDRKLVYLGHDDGDDEICAPRAVLTASKASGWGAFFLERDARGRWWTAARPVHGVGAVWTSVDGERWQRVAEASQEDLPLWRGTHTFRDATLGQTGSGANLSGRGAMLVPCLNHALLLDGEE